MTIFELSCEPYYKALIKYVSNTQSDQYLLLISESSIWEDVLGCHGIGRNNSNGRIFIGIPDKHKTPRIAFVSPPGARGWTDNRFTSSKRQLSL